MDLFKKFTTGIKEAVIRKRIKDACAKLSVAEDVKLVIDDTFLLFMDAVKGHVDSYAAFLPVIQNVIKNNPDQVADIVIEVQKILVAVNMIKETSLDILDDETIKNFKAVVKDIEKVKNRKFKEKTDELGKKGKAIKTNLDSVISIIFGKMSASEKKAEPAAEPETAKV